MPAFALLIGLAVTALGPIFYLISEAKSGTAFIPSGFGVLIVLLAAIAMKGGNIRKHMMHGVAVVALLGTLGGLGMGLPKLFASLGSAEGVTSLAPYSQSIMGVLCAILLIACINSFVQARKNRSAA